MKNRIFLYKKILTQVAFCLHYFVFQILNNTLKKNFACSSTREIGPSLKPLAEESGILSTIERKSVDKKKVDGARNILSERDKPHIKIVRRNAST